MRTSIKARLHHGQVAFNEMESSSEAFWWPGVYREIQEKSERYLSCRAAGNKSTGPIKFRTRGDVHILVAIDRFSKWPNEQICKNTDTRTFMKI